MAYGRRYGRRTVRRRSSLIAPRPTPPPAAELQAGAITTTSPHDGVTHTDDGRDVVTHVDTIETLLEWISHTQGHGTDAGLQADFYTEDTGEETIGRLPWHGTETWGEAVALARDGWPAGAALVDRYASVHADRLASLIEQPVWTMDREGDGFDVGTMLSGEPEHWYHRETRHVESFSRSIYRIRMGVTTSSGVNVAAIIARGAAVLALVNLLELAGHGTDVAAIYSGASNEQGRRTVVIGLKHAEHPPDMARLAFALANPAMQRRLGFEAIRHMPRGQYLADHGYGSGSLGFDPPGSLRGDIYLGGMSLKERNWTDKDAVSAWIVARLAACGVTLAERS